MPGADMPATCRFGVNFTAISFVALAAWREWK
jgi:hypothetical protein